MLTGFSGHLISEFFLERAVEASLQSSAANELSPAAIDRWRRRRCLDLGPASSLRALLEAGAEPLVELLGFTRVGPTVHLKGAAATTIAAGTQPVALVVASWGEALDGHWRAAIEHAARIGAAWCVLFNGTHVRLIDGRRLYTRRHVEFEIDLAADDARSLEAFQEVLSVAALMRHADGVSKLDAMIAASDRHSASVCRSLRTGVFDASTEVFRALASSGRSAGSDAAYEQSLTIVYRILFLLFAEARHLVPLWHPVYRGSYSVEALCAAAEKRESPVGLWDAIRAMSRLAHAGCRVGDLHVTAFNGRLFSPARTPLVERRTLDDGAAKRALLALSTRPAADRQGRERIAYRDLGVEELGGVYENLLDYKPSTGRALQGGSGERKATGTFYTPRPIAEYLVRRTLGPLVTDVPPEQILALRVLDPSMGSGAFLVAACAFLAEAYEAALVARGGCRSADFGARERASIRRTIAERCLFGVDLNPMAVQLGRLSLWLATLAADRPLSFLDHHLVTGDSTLGTWIALLNRTPDGIGKRGDGRTLPLFDVEALDETMRASVPARFSLAEAPNDTPEQVREKERVLSALNRPGTPLARWKAVADLWCARWFMRDAQYPAQAYLALCDWILAGRCALPSSAAERYVTASREVAAARKFFHWELEFPEVFFGSGGGRRTDAGFDAVLGNPPWDMVRGDAGDVEGRASSREAAQAVLRFTRDSGVYASQSDGHANRYQLFVERAISLTRSGGRIGLVLPSGLAVDHGSAPLRHLLFSRCNVDGITGFENRSRIFQIHRSVRFHLLTATAGSETHEFGCRFGEQDPRILDADGRGDEPESFPVHVTPALLERVSGPGLAVPDFRCAMDVRIAERAAALFPALGDREGWFARFGRELNATDDRRFFQTGARGFAVVEGKAIEPFRFNRAAVNAVIRPADAVRLLGQRCLRPRLAYRDVASATNRLTLIAAMLPRRTASTHTVFCLRTPLPARAQFFLCGLFNSFIVNYLVRLRVTTHVTTAIVERLPIPREHDCPAAFRRISAIARLLGARPDPRLFAELNAEVASIYQLSRDEFAHVLDTFPLVAGEDRNLALAAADRRDVAI